MSEIQLFICVYAFLFESGRSRRNFVQIFIIAEAEVVEYIKRLELKWSFEYQSVKLV